MDKVILSLIAGLLVSVVSFAGVVILLLKTERLRGITHYLISLAVGVLLGDAFLHLIPDAIKRTGNFNDVLLFTLVGILLFFFLEKVVRWNHNHSIPALHSASSGGKHIGQMNLVGDALHNFIDGTLIAGSFLVDVKLGITTTVAIIIHEIPQEIGDIGTLIYSGYSPKKAIWLNFLCSLSCLAGVIAVLVIGNLINLPLDYILPIAAGGFIYIATSDLIPVLHEKKELSKDLAQGAIICLGIGSMILLSTIEQMIK